MNTLAPMPEDWDRALCIVAHPDDMEYGPAAAVVRWTDQGKHVAYTIVSSGEAGIEGMAPEEAGPLREQEERASARVSGVDVVEFLGHPDSAIAHGVTLLRDIAMAIRRHQPELIVTLNHRATWAIGGTNTSDHRNAGQAVIDAVADAADPTCELGIEPWSGVRWVAVAASPQMDHAVDTTATIDRALQALREHRAYLAALHGGARASEEHVQADAAHTGREFGTDFACGFELLPFSTGGN